MERKINAAMEAIFVASGHIVNFMGSVLAVFWVAFIPLYFYGLMTYRKKIKLRSSRFALFIFIGTVALTVLLTVVFAMTSVVLGMWG